MKAIIKAVLAFVPATLIIMVALIASILSPNAASAATYYVATGGNDGNPGTEASPFRTIEHGVSVLSAGDTLRIRGGTYAESFTWFSGGGSSWSNPITIAAAPDETVIWEVPAGAQSAFGILDVHYVIFQGIIWDGMNGSNRMAQLGYTTWPVTGAQTLVGLNCVANDPNRCAHHVRFEGNEFRYTAYSVTHSSADVNNIEFISNDIHHIGKVSNCPTFYITGPNVIFDGNSFHDLACPAIVFWNQNAATVHNGIIRNNYIVRAGWFWAPDNGSVEGGTTPLQQNTPNLRAPALFVTRGRGAKVYNNIIVDSPGGIYAGHGAQDCVIYNNTIYGNTASGIGDPDYNAGITLDDLSGGSTNCMARNNIVYQPGVTSPLPIVNLGANNVLSNNLTTDPLFVNPSADDFRLQPGSPAVDRGTTLAEVTEDYDGVPRPQGDAYDIGAYEN